MSRLTGWVTLLGVFLLVLGDPRPLDALVGALVAAVAVAAVGPTPLRAPEQRASGPLRRLAGVPGVVAWVVADVLRGTWRVTLAVLGIRPPRAPGTVRIDLDEGSEQALVATGLLLTISPGSVLVGADPASGSLRVHLLDADDPSDTRRRIGRLHGHVRAVSGG
jgi:multisubunit Na+/H+ antiporter MnhE subunit